MADTRVRIIYQFAEKHQHAELRCGGCGRIVILPPKLIETMFHPLTALDLARRRLRCRSCGARRATIVGVYRTYHHADRSDLPAETGQSRKAWRG